MGQSRMISDMLQYIVLVSIAFRKVTRDKRYEPNTSIGLNIISRVVKKHEVRCDNFQRELNSSKATNIKFKLNQETHSIVK